MGFDYSIMTYKSYKSSLQTDNSWTSPEIWGPFWGSGKDVYFGHPIIISSDINQDCYTAWLGSNYKNIYFSSDKSGEWNNITLPRLSETNAHSSIWKYTMILDTTGQLHCFWSEGVVINNSLCHSHYNDSEWSTPEILANNVKQTRISVQVSSDGTIYCLIYDKLWIKSPNDNCSLLSLPNIRLGKVFWRGNQTIDIFGIQHPSPTPNVYYLHSTDNGQQWVNRTLIDVPDSDNSESSFSDIRVSYDQTNTCYVIADADITCETSDPSTFKHEKYFYLKYHNLSYFSPQFDLYTQIDPEIRLLEFLVTPNGNLHIFWDREGENLEHGVFTSNGTLLYQSIIMSNTDYIRYCKAILTASNELQLVFITENSRSPTLFTWGFNFMLIILMGLVLTVILRKKIKTIP